jgi:hypothetical protein
LRLSMQVDTAKSFGVQLALKFSIQALRRQL